MSEPLTRCPYCRLYFRDFPFHWCVGDEELVEDDRGLPDRDERLDPLDDYRGPGA